MEEKEMNTTGVVPTLPIGGYDHNGWGDDGFGGIFALIVLAAMFGNGGLFGGNNGMVSNIATADQVATQGLQNNLFDMNNNMNNGFQNTNSNLFNGFDRVSDNVCDVRQAVYNTGAGLANQVLENRYTNQLAEGQTQRDILMQTSQLGNQASVNALEAQANMDRCCCDIKTAIAADGEKTRALITDNLIQDLRTQLVDEKNKNSDLVSVASTISAIRPYPTPSYIVSSPYSSIYNPYGLGFNNGFYGNNF